VIAIRDCEGIWAGRSLLQLRARARTHTHTRSSELSQHLGQLKVAQTLEDGATVYNCNNKRTD